MSQDILFCGKCFYDMGILRPLTEFVRPKGSSERPGAVTGYACSFCQTERHGGGSYPRVREVTNVSGKPSNEETSLRIPHVVTADGKPV